MNKVVERSGLTMSPGPFFCKESCTKGFIRYEKNNSDCYVRTPAYCGMQ